jgi:ankyrin repeat protein
MTILSSRCACGCTSLKLTPNTVIEAKQSIELDVQMSGGAKAGPLAGKSCTFVVEGQPEIMVQLKANAVSFVSSVPEVIDPQIQTDGKFVLKARDGQPFKIISMQPAVVTEFSTEAAAEQPVTLDWAKFRELGVNRKATFYLDHPKCQMAMVDINFTPEELQVEAEKLRAKAIKDRSAMDPKVAKGQVPDANQTPVLPADPDSQLTQLIREGKTSDVIAKLGTGLDVNYKNATNVSLLGQAGLYGNVELIKALVATGKVTIDAPDNVGRTPLMQAAQSKNVEAVRELLKAGASPSVRDQIGGTALTWAAGFGDAASVQELIDAGSDADIVGLITGWTPLIWAAGFGDAKSIEPIVAAKGNIEHADNLQGATALIHAARTGKVDSIKALVKLGAKMETKDLNGNTALLIASGTSGGDVEKLQALIDLGANLQAKDNRGFNALDLALKRTDMRAADVVKLLQDKGLTPTPEKPAPATETPAAGGH